MHCKYEYFSNKLSHTRMKKQSLHQNQGKITQTLRYLELNQNLTWERELSLTFKNCASYIQDGCTATLQNVAFYILFQQILSTEYFKHVAHSPFFTSKCRLFHNAVFFGSCIIHVLHKGVLKFNCKI
jgi:hypothetical protein